MPVHNFKSIKLNGKPILSFEKQIEIAQKARAMPCPISAVSKAIIECSIEWQKQMNKQKGVD